jgi:hypothetical protein
MHNATVIVLSPFFSLSAFLIVGTAVPVTRAIIAVCPAFLAKAVYLAVSPVTPVSIDAVAAISVEASLRQNNSHHFLVFHVLHVKFLLDI